MDQVFTEFVMMHPSGVPASAVYRMEGHLTPENRTAAHQWAASWTPVLVLHRRQVTVSSWRLVPAAEIDRPAS